LAKALQQRNRTQAQINTVHKSIHLVTNATRKIEAEVMAELQNQSGVAKQGSGTKRDNEKVKSKIRDTLFCDNDIRL
jgi:septal ring factor EnvC (AmiA/AmiB activator)